MYWTPVSDSRCEQLVEEKGYVVGVINKVILGVVQVDDLKIHEKIVGEKLGRVEFTGKLLNPRKANAKNIAPATPGTINPGKMNSTNINKAPKLNNIKVILGCAKKFRKCSCTVMPIVSILGLEIFNIVALELRVTLCPSID